MKNKLSKQFLNNIHYLVRYAFWFYFLFIISYYYLINDNIPLILNYIFWLLFGIYLGYFLGRKSRNVKIK